MRLSPKHDKALIAPSILSADFARLGEEVKALCEAGADCLHLDVMDGHFVPNLTIGPDIVKSVKKHSSVPLDVHLMVTNPEQYIERFADAGADIITVHVECPTALEALNKIHAVRVSSGVAISPNTEASSIDAFIADIDLVLIMTVQPGFAAQSFMSNQLSKIRYMHHKAVALNRSDLLIAIDGGINDQTAKLCIEAGANMLMAGSYILKDGAGYAKKIAALQRASSATFNIKQ